MEYFHFLIFNIFVYTLIFIIIQRNILDFISTNQKIVRNACFGIFLLEPLLANFGSILEREVIVAAMLLLLYLSYVHKRWSSCLIWIGILFLFRKELFFLCLLLYMLIKTDLFFKFRTRLLFPLILIGGAF